MKDRLLTFALAAGCTLIVALAATIAVASPAAPLGLCGKARGAAFASDECAAGQQPVQLVVCQDAATGKLSARADRCKRGELALSLTEIAEGTGALTPDGVFTTPADEPVAGINKCGQAACLCTGTFCADLIDKGYCKEFRCAEDQCLCEF